MMPLGRRDFLSAMLTLPVAGCISRPLPVKSPYASAIPDREAGTLVNDVHSQLNATRVAGIVKPRDVTELRTAIAAAAASGQSVSIAGGRHAMGGQQFGEANLLVDTRALVSTRGHGDTEMHGRNTFLCAP
jgi:FAD/FMN-containing dehydrogenase